MSTSQLSSRTPSVQTYAGPVYAVSVSVSSLDIGHADLEGPGFWCPLSPLALTLLLLTLLLGSWSSGGMDLREIPH